MLTTLGILLLITTVVTVAVYVGRWMIAREQTLSRWYSQGDIDVTSVLESSSPRGWLAGWIYLAGYRRPISPLFFIVATIACGLIGFGAATLFVVSGLQSIMEETVVLVPGGVGETFLPVVWVAPWIIAIGLLCLPLLVVRAARRKRVAMIEQDLPLAMELMATLSEAGLGFDSALIRILKTRLAGRPLAEELRMYQADLLAGRARASIHCVDLAVAFASVRSPSSSLRWCKPSKWGWESPKCFETQADDIRARRRERAIAFANALPVKRLFPLVICFLPGLFVWTLGPAFVQLFKLTETFTRGGGF